MVLTGTRSLTTDRTDTELPGRVAAEVGMIIGLGSVGRHHARALADRCERLLVVDPQEASRAAAIEALGSERTRVHASLAEALDGHPTPDIAVIANWGPDHAATFAALADVGVTRILCEKPLAHSAELAWQMAERAERDGIRLVAGLSRRFVGLVPYLGELAERYAGGPIVAVAAHGGAAGMVTTGVHWLDLAAAIFDRPPTSVVASLRDTSINPRHPELGFWEGSAAWEFGPDRRVTMTFTNQSSVAPTVHLYGPTGRIDLEADGSLVVGSRDREQVLADPRPTRTGPLTSRLVDARDPIVFADPFPLLVQETLSDGPPLYPAHAAASLTEAMLAALAASERRSVIELPMDRSDPHFSRPWAAS